MPLLPLPNCQRTNRKTSIPKFLPGVILRHNLGWAEAGPNSRAEFKRRCFGTASNHHAGPLFLPSLLIRGIVGTVGHNAERTWYAPGGRSSRIVGRKNSDFRKRGRRGPKVEGVERVRGREWTDLLPHILSPHLPSYPILPSHPKEGVGRPFRAVARIRRPGMAVLQPPFRPLRPKRSGDDRDRTGNLRVANAALSQLSYVPGTLGALGFEPRTSALSGLRSNQLSYAPGNLCPASDCNSPAVHPSRAACRCILAFFGRTVQ